VVAHLSRHPPVDGVEPRDFELQIGARSGGKAPTLAAVPITLAAGRNIHLGGVIDRVDDGVGGRAVVDYKTMSAARVKEKAAPKTLFESHFQLLIYLRLLEHHRPTTTATPLHGYLVSLKDGVTSNDVGTTELLRERLFDDNRDDSLGAAIGRVILPILDGTVPPDAGDRCSDCRLQRICRVPQEGAFAPDPDEREDDGATP
jgi:CRISPR/Cas system-associated exonuclease Cas4 (RecB family)